MTFPSVSASSWMDSLDSGSFTTSGWRVRKDVVSVDLQLLGGEIEGEGVQRKATVFFPSTGKKQLLLKFAKLRIV